MIKYFWFENAWEQYRGIHEFDNIKNLLIHIKSKFINTLEDNKIDYMNLCIYKYKKVKENLTCLEFYKHAEKGKNIIIK